LQKAVQRKGEVQLQTEGLLYSVPYFFQFHPALDIFISKRYVDDQGNRRTKFVSNYDKQGLLDTLTSGLPWQGKLLYGAFYNDLLLEKNLFALCTGCEISGKIIIGANSFQVPRGQRFGKCPQDVLLAQKLFQFNLDSPVYIGGILLDPLLKGNWHGLA